MSVRPAAEKIVTREAVLERFRRPRSETVVFTNGVFDLLHRGHSAYLEASRGLGDVLVVGLNTDASTRRLSKGSGRPLNGERDRALVLAALECVDSVCLFDDDTPAALIEALVPDVLVKGGDYDLDGVVGRETVEAAGGRVELIPFVEGYSTSDLLQRIRGMTDE
jgi:D-beta-D-heptose 7-phosphate kinase / D-beta-D-heptose 1-phosphate adenosyltransferase